MKKLTTTGLLLIDKHMEIEARPLENALYRYYFKKGEPQDIAKELEIFQNSDGGFGHGLEPDFWTPDSSAMATSIGLKYLKLVEHLPEGKDMIRKAITYLENTYNSDRKGWFSVPQSVNDYPHAPWWTFDEGKQLTVIDDDWGNPSAELIGYLYHFKKYLQKLNVKELIEVAINHYNHEADLKSEHEVYCYIRFYNNLKSKDQTRLEDKISHAVSHLMNPDMDQWTTYVPMPINFVEYDSDNLFNMHIKDINKNLDYIMDKLEDDKHIEPVWTWADYKEAWVEAKKYWTGILTLETMLKLKKFEKF